MAEQVQETLCKSKLEHPPPHTHTHTGRPIAFLELPKVQLISLCSVKIGYDNADDVVTTVTQMKTNSTQSAREIVKKIIKNKTRNEIYVAQSFSHRLHMQRNGRSRNPANGSNCRH